MAERRLLSIGYEIPGFSDSYLPFESDRSLLDADVILFYPTLCDFSSSTYFQGKRRIDNDQSTSAVEHCERWRQELAEALKAGKTVVVFLAALEEVYVHLGKKEVSGTGRNQKVTHIVELLTNYSALPFDLGTIVPKGGIEIRTVGDLKQLASSWMNFGVRSPYQVYLKAPSGTPILTAKSPEAIVGLVVKVGRGTPYYYRRLSMTRRNSPARTKTGRQFGPSKRLLLVRKWSVRLLNLTTYLEHKVRLLPLRIGSADRSLLFKPRSLMRPKLY